MNARGKCGCLTLRVLYDINLSKMFFLTSVKQQMKCEVSRVALWRFVDDCHKHSIRCALITHGKGEGRQEPAKLKSCVNHWLRQFDEVLAFHSAQKQHGGVGSTYVLIKKDRSARQKTSEKIDHSRRIKR